VFINGTLEQLGEYSDSPVRLQATMQSQVSNAMTWQLGGPSYGPQYRDSVDPEAVLQRAKRAIDEMAFVGFYETMLEDFWRLWSTVFSDSSVPGIYPWAYMIGTLISAPRRTVARLSAQVDPHILQQLRELNQMDMELYEYAMGKAGKSIELFDSYWEFCYHHFIHITVVVIVMAAMIAGVVLACMRCCGACIRCMYVPRRNKVLETV
jgi:hypothetical protein